MMKRMIQYQQDNELFCFIASYHSLTTVDQAKVLSSNILETAADFLALGLDPKKSIFWVQSDIPEVTELTWLLSHHITVSQLELAHSFKDKIANGIPAGSGLFCYPVLMASDILLFGTDKVPVGKDQKQHLEITRDIAGRFNQKYGEVFKIPDSDILTDTALVPGVDGKKMSKSYNNAIYPFDSEKNLKKSIMSITTDSTPVDQPKNHEDSILFEIFRLFLNDEEQIELIERFKTPGEGYGHLKLSLLEKVMDYFSDARKRREEFISRPDEIRDILKEGADKARKVAAPILARARQAVGLVY